MVSDRREQTVQVDLARHWSAGRRQSGAETGSLSPLVRALSPLPAMVVDHRFDIVAWNPEMAWLDTVAREAHGGTPALRAV
ncbi:MAG TPA: hypothetical protein VE198_07215 [Actinoallomurus sp.]|nr:hypothetical protein [Actinoallomurus sp.]